MATTTHRIAVNDAAYTNISNGNVNCTLINGNEAVRLVVGSSDAAPSVDTLDFIHVSGSGILTAENLEAEDDVWIRAEQDEVDLRVIRGPARIQLMPT